MDKETNPMTPDEINHYHTDAVVCPYCGHSHSDSYEFFPSIYQESAEVECGECEKEFKAYRNISVNYSTYKTDE